MPACLGLGLDRGTIASLYIFIFPVLYDRWILGAVNAESLYSCLSALGVPLVDDQIHVTYIKIKKTSKNLHISCH